MPGGGLLSLAIAAAASAAGAWCGVAGLPELGVRSAAGVGMDPSRLLLVSDPGQRWPQVAAALLDGCDLVLIRPPARPATHVQRHIEAILRRAGGVLLVAGDWPGAQARLWVAAQQWVGLGAGHGRLMGRRVQVLASGRGAATRPAQRWLWLPGPDGGVAAANPGIAGLAGSVLAGSALPRSASTGSASTGSASTGSASAGSASAGPRLAGPEMARLREMTVRAG